MHSYRNPHRLPWDLPLEQHELICVFSWWPLVALKSFVLGLVQEDYSVVLSVGQPQPATTTCICSLWLWAMYTKLYCDHSQVQSMRLDVCQHIVTTSNIIVIFILSWCRNVGELFPQNLLEDSWSVRSSRNGYYLDAQCLNKLSSFYHPIKCLASPRNQARWSKCHHSLWCLESI